MKESENNREKIFESIKNILFKKGYNNPSINYDTFLDKVADNSLYMTSLEIIDFIVEVENHYNIIVDISERFYTIDDVINSIILHLNER